MRSTLRTSTPAWAQWVTNYTWPGEFLSFFLSFFLSRVANTQLNQWTKRVVSTREWPTNDTWMRVWVTNYTWMRSTSRNSTPAEWVTNYTWMREWVTNCKRTLNARNLSQKLQQPAPDRFDLAYFFPFQNQWITKIPTKSTDKLIKMNMLMQKNGESRNSCRMGVQVEGVTTLVQVCALVFFQVLGWLWEWKTG